MDPWSCQSCLVNPRTRKIIWWTPSWRCRCTITPMALWVAKSLTRYCKDRPCQCRVGNEVGAGHLHRRFTFLKLHERNSVPVLLCSSDEHSAWQPTSQIVLPSAQSGCVCEDLVLISNIHRTQTSSEQFEESIGFGNLEMLDRNESHFVSLGIQSLTLFKATELVLPS